MEGGRGERDRQRNRWTDRATDKGVTERERDRDSAWKELSYLTCLLEKLQQTTSVECILSCVWLAAKTVHFLLSISIFTGG